mmetsp:Transcript_35531/g.92608  ORF Transcript_35531/g.92608 Transcript_35531/m.92608 type:complete len:86 (+) Transcript_35531:737-994(+)
MTRTVPQALCLPCLPKGSLNKAKSGTDTIGDDLIFPVFLSPLFSFPPSRVHLSFPLLPLPIHIHQLFSFFKHGMEQAEAKAMIQI